jgi:hypothetical protein
MDSMVGIEVCSEILRPAYLLAHQASGFQFVGGRLMPSEHSSDEEPPEWPMRDERWTIDGLLGCYDASQQRITIFNKGIEVIAPKFGLQPELLEMIVKVHEYGHSIFHLGMMQPEIISILGMPPQGKGHMIADILRMRTETYNEVPRYVHEQIAQSITKIALINLRASATKEQSRNVCDKMIEAFNALMHRQPEEYRLDHVAHLTDEQLGERLHKFIVLMHRGALIPDRGVWDTIMAW